MRPAPASTLPPPLCLRRVEAALASCAARASAFAAPGLVGFLLARGSTCKACKHQWVSQHILSVTLSGVHLACSAVLWVTSPA